MGRPEASRGTPTLWASATQVVRRCRLKPDRPCLSRDSNRAHRAAKPPAGGLSRSLEKGLRPSGDAGATRRRRSVTSPVGVASPDCVGGGPGWPITRALPAVHSARSDAVVPVIVGDRCSGPRRPATVARWNGVMHVAGPDARPQALSPAGDPAQFGFGAVSDYLGAGNAPPLRAPARDSPGRGLSGGHGGTVPGPGGGSAWRVPRSTRPGAI